MKSTSQAMDFFEHQERARASSRRFTFLYIIAVFLICAAVASVAGLVAWMGNQAPQDSPAQVIALVALIAAAITALIIVGGSLYRISELRGGGSSVAMSLGGRLIDPSSRNPNERKLLNVIEEMAIASGVPVPPVFLMPSERGINAFAAGYAPGDAVIGVTQGCVDGLTRDELQGIMAHEFSHILNGDMRLNIRMIGLLNGIVLISLIGHIVFQTTPRYTRGKEGFAIQISWITLGIVLITIGSIGTLTARIIQSKVSRQREFLADASAVQFTRNPNGIANALRRIGGHSRRASVRHPRTQEAGHMFFGQAIRTTSMMRATLASHPPLKERIIRIDPSWDGTMLESLIAEDDIAPLSNQEKLDSLIPDIGIGQAAALLPMLALSGTMTPAHIEHAQSLILAIPEPLREAAHDIFSGRAVVYALLLDRKDAGVHQSQIEHLNEHADPVIAAMVEVLSSSASTMNADLRLTLLDMTLGSLAHLSENQHQIFRANVKALIKMDKAIDLFEWVTMGVFTRNLDERFGSAKPQVTQYYSLAKLDNELSVLLSALAHAGAQDEYDVGEALLLGEGSLRNSMRGTQIKLLSKAQSDLSQLDAALKTLASCSGKLKRDMLKACALVVSADHEITRAEAELLRAVADALGVPTPPLLPGQKLI
ncbi:MAG: M48 family metalloprotease [Phycisphaerales bacterium]|nr:M48 family metalloprotease [Phycisphaerales bacterium]